MKLRIKLAGRKDKVDFGDNVTIATAKEIVAQLFGQDAGNFELSLNGRDFLEGVPDTPLSDFDIVSGDLLHIIVTGEARGQALGADDQGSSSATPKASCLSLCSGGMDVDDNANKESDGMGTTRTTDKTEELGTHDPTSRTSMSGAGPQQGGTGSVIQAPLGEGADAPRSTGEPMLCRSATDCMIPQRLRALYVENKPQSLNEALCVALHVLMLETGFYPEPQRQSSPPSSQVSVVDCGPSTSFKKPPVAPSVDGDVCSDTRASMPPNWRGQGFYKLSYYHLSCEGALCSIACTPVGNLIVVHGITCGKSRFHLKLKSSDYVTTLNDKQPMYTNLPELSRLYKDSIAYPLLLTTRAELGLVPLNGLLALFPEIQLLILSFLDVRSLLSMSEVSRHFSNMAADRLLWRQLLLRDFGCKDTDNNLDWRQLYKRKYKNKKDLERYRRNLMDRSLPVSPGMFYPPPPLPPTMPGYPPGYRGGDYDLDPFAGLAPPPLNVPFRRDPTIMPFPGQPNASPFPDRSPLRDPILNPLPRIPNRRDPLGNSRTGGNTRGFHF